LQAAPSASDVSPPTAVAARNETQGLSPVRQAMQQVDQILESLQEVLDDMEHVLKVLQEAERQKSGDEQEIESLRQKLNKLQRGKIE
jgi:hypothetical protein